MEKDLLEELRKKSDVLIFLICESKNTTKK